MAFYSVCGLTGSGKSLKQIQFGIELANRYRKILVTNFPVNFPVLRRYCGFLKYHWLGHMIDLNRVIVLPGVENIEELLGYQNAVILIDEAGVFLDAWSGLSKRMRADLCQIRHDGIDVVWAAQYFEQVNKQLRMLCHRCIHADGVQTYNRQLKNDCLIWKNYYHFHPKNYEAWLNDMKAQKPGLGGMLRTRFQYAQKVESGPLNKADYQAFSIFKSFGGRLDKGYSKSLNPYFIPAYHQVTHYFEGDYKPIELKKSSSSVSMPTKTSGDLDELISLAKKKD